MTLPPQIVDLQDYTETTNILCHGDTGSGKTVLWAALPNILILAVEEGTVSAKRRLPPPKRGQLRKVWRVRTWQDLEDAYEWLLENPGVFQWVMIDSITKAQALCIKAIMQKVVQINPARDKHIPAQGDHFKWQLSMKEMVSDFNELPQNIIWIARSMVKTDPDGNDIIVPLIEGKDYQISAWVCGEMHLLCYLKKEARKGDSSKMVRKLYTNEHAMYWCKDRYDVLPHIIQNPDANKIINLIDSSGNRPVEGSVSTRTRKTAPARRTTTRKVANA